MGNALSLLNVFAAAASCKNLFLGLLPWNYYLTMDPATCEVSNFHLLGANSSILLIVLAITDDLLRIAGLLAVVFVIYAGVKFILSQGSPDEAAKARTAAVDAMVGLAITMTAIAFVTFLGSKAGSGTGDSSTGGLNLSGLPHPSGGGLESGALISSTLLPIVFGVIGALSFLIIVIAGFRYVLSQGEPQAAVKAKNTIIYALIGLVLAIVAQSVVSLAVNHK